MSHLDVEFLKRVFGEVGQWVYDQTGIEVPGDGQDFDIYENPRGSISCAGKLSYRGPVSPRSMPRINIPAAFRGGAGETIMRERVLRLPISTARQSHIEVIRYAAANRLLVEIGYRDEKGVRSTRLIEAYSLAQTQAGDIILHTHDRRRNAHRAFRIDRIEGARVTDQTFEPRFQIELAPHGPVRVAPAPYKAPMPSPRAAFGGVARSQVRRPTRTSAGVKYVIQCPVCQKKFTRSTNDRKLNRHKNDWGTKCSGSGRNGYLVDTR